MKPEGEMEEKFSIECTHWDYGYADGGRLIKESEMWLVMKLNKWEGVGLEQVGPYRIPIPFSLAKPEGSSIGFVEVFENYHEALEVAENPELVKKIALKGEGE